MELLKGHWNWSKKIELASEMNIRPKMRRCDFFRIFNFDREVCEKVIQKSFPSFLIRARRFLLVPVVSYWCMSTFSSRDLFFFTYSNEDFEIVSYLYNPPKVRKSWWCEFDLCNPPKRNTLVFRRFLAVPVVSYWCPSFLIRARRFLTVHEKFFIFQAPIRNDGHQ